MQNFRSVVNNQPALPDSVIFKREKLRKASDPTTSPEVLDELADFPEFIIQQAVAENPNTTLETLIKLAGVGINVHKHPSILRTHVHGSSDNHPFLKPELISHEDPEISSHRLRNFLVFASHPQAHIDSLRILAKHPNEKVVAAVLKNKAVTPEFLFSLAEHPSSYIRSLIAKHSMSSAPLLKQMVDASSNKKQTPELGIIASNIKCPGEALHKLSSDSRAWVRRNVARNANCPIQTLSSLAFDNNALVRSSVIKHKNTPTYILARMALDAEPAIRSALARRLDMPGKVLDKLSFDSSSNVRLKVASNPNTPSVVLDRLSGDRDSQVRAAVARNQNASEHAIERVKSFQHMPDQDSEISIFNSKISL